MAKYPAKKSKPKFLLEIKWLKMYTYYLLKNMIKTSMKLCWVWDILVKFLPFWMI